MIGICTDFIKQFARWKWRETEAKRSVVYQLSLLKKRTIGFRQSLVNAFIFSLNAINLATGESLFLVQDNNMF
jgi:hypothetical protein